MRQKVNIRPSQEKDFQKLMELNHLIWNQKNTPSVIHYTALEHYGKDCPAGSQFVALVDEEIAGYVGYRNPTPLSSNRHVLELDLGIHPDFQRQGVGRALMDYIVEWGKSRGVTKITVRVLETNPSAISFYQANGFIEQGRLVNEFLINNQYIDDILMYKII